MIMEAYNSTREIGGGCGINGVVQIENCVFLSNKEVTNVAFHRCPYSCNTGIAKFNFYISNSSLSYGYVYNYG